MRRMASVIFCLWLGILFARSLLYSFRIAYEFTHPIHVFLPEITSCSPFDPSADDEQQHVQRYRHFGAICEN
jgi:hypothetical protein